jgi:FKBP-type peptidyl-prolyl cis-trans isomerase
MIEKIESLEEKVQMAKEINDEEKTEDSRQDYEDLLDFLQDAEQDFQDELKAIAEKKQNAEKEKAKVEQANAKAKTDAEAKTKADAEELAKKNESVNPKEEKKGGLGWFIFGAVVLVATAGVVNVMRNK